MSHWKLEWFEDISFYLGMEVPHDAQECNVTLMRFDAKVNVLSWRFELVSPMQVIEDRGDHIDMMPEEEEVYSSEQQD